MEYSDKVPITTDSKKQSNKYSDRLMRQLQIILKLAKINGYDIGGRIRNQKGQYLDNSSILHLLSHSMTSSRVLVGEQEFIDLLYEANIEPDTLLNDNVRAKLFKRYNLENTNKAPEPVVTQTVEPEVNISRKRPIEEPEMPDLEGPFDYQPQAKRTRIDELHNLNDKPMNETTPEANKNNRKRNWNYPEND